ncbi:hypothetical protein [Bacillus altitudinis]|uniref:hypothetical protein n=1 Tax=Bacillus altitudinis TaxID=293387 RepID=UPI00119FB843|nr:hypothetical protein [Bacillus altitudinis]
MEVDDGGLCLNGRRKVNIDYSERRGLRLEDGYMGGRGRFSDKKKYVNGNKGDGGGDVAR